LLPILCNNVPFSTSDFPHLAPHWHDGRLRCAEASELKRIVLKAVALVVLLLGGWFIFGYVLPGAIKVAMQPLATSQVRPASVPPRPIQVTPSSTAPVMSGPNTDELEWQKRVQLQAANALLKKRDLAWEAFYTPPASREHPPDWTAQVECGNLYMRAKKVFEQKWTTEHP
jgi:hypothetical protein